MKFTPAEIEEFEYLHQIEQKVRDGVDLLPEEKSFAINFLITLPQRGLKPHIITSLYVQHGKLLIGRGVDMEPNEFMESDLSTKAFTALDCIADNTFTKEQAIKAFGISEEQLEYFRPGWIKHKAKIIS